LETGDVLWIEDIVRIEEELIPSDRIANKILPSALCKVHHLILTTRLQRIKVRNGVSREERPSP
jgi:hypothetical protein